MGWGRKALGATLLGLGAGGNYYGDIKKKQAEAELFPETTADIKDYNKLLTMTPAERSLFISSKAAGKATYDPDSDTVKPVYKPSTRGVGKETVSEKMIRLRQQYWTGTISQEDKEWLKAAETKPSTKSGSGIDWTKPPE